MRPDVGLLTNDPRFARRLLHPRSGGRFLLRDYLIPQVEQSYEDLLEAAAGADLLLTHVVGFAGPIVAEVLKLPWIFVALQPAVLFSVHDPPVLAEAQWARHLYRFGPGLPVTDETGPDTFEWLDSSDREVAQAAWIGGL